MPILMEGGPPPLSACHTGSCISQDSIRSDHSSSPSTRAVRDDDNDNDIKPHQELAPFPHVERPHRAKNPKLSVHVEAWIEQPHTMVIGWVGMAQLAMLALSVASAIVGFRAILIRVVGASTTCDSPEYMVTTAMIALTAPVAWLLHDVIARFVVYGVAWVLDTFWCWVSLKLFANRDASIVHDGLPCGYKVNFLRASYNHKKQSKMPRRTQSMYIVYPCQEEDSYLRTHETQPMEYGWDCWALRSSTEDEINIALQHEATVGDENIRGSKHHAIVYLHGGGFVAANAGVLLQQAVTMARHKRTVVYALEYPLAPTYPFPAAVCSVLQALSHIRNARGVTHATIVGDSAGGSIASYVTTLLTSPKLYRKFVQELSLFYPGELPWSFCDTVEDDGLLDGFPRVICHVAIYGVLDDQTYYEQWPLQTITWWENVLARHGLAFCMKCYRGSGTKSCLPAHPADLWTNDTLEWDRTAFPPTFLICGNQDPLLASSNLAGRRLGCKVQIFSGRHAIVGFLRAWLNPRLRSQAAQADAAVQDFISGTVTAAMAEYDENKCNDRI